MLKNKEGHHSKPVAKCQYSYYINSSCQCLHVGSLGLAIFAMYTAFKKATIQLMAVEI